MCIKTAESLSEGRSSEGSVRGCFLVWWRLFLSTFGISSLISAAWLSPTALIFGSNLFIIQFSANVWRRHLHKRGRQNRGLIGISLMPVWVWVNGASGLMWRSRLQVGIIQGNQKTLKQWRQVNWLVEALLLLPLGCGETFLSLQKIGSQHSPKPPHSVEAERKQLLH